MRAPYVLVTPGFLRPMRAFETMNIRISVRNGDPDEALAIELSGVAGGINSVLTRTRTVKCTERDANGLPSTRIKIHSIKAGEPVLIIRSPTDRFVKTTIVCDTRAIIALPPSPGDITLDQETDEPPFVEEDEGLGTSRPAAIMLADSSAEVAYALWDPEDETDGGILGGQKRWGRDLVLLQEPARPKRAFFRPTLIAALAMFVLLPMHMTPEARTEEVAEEPETPPVVLELPPEEAFPPEPPMVEEIPEAPPQNCTFFRPSMLKPTMKSAHEDTKGQYVVRCDDDKLYTASSSQMIDGQWVHTGLKVYTQ